MTDISCAHCGTGLRRLRDRRHGLGRSHHFSCPKCGKGVSYADVPAIASTFAFAAFVPLFSGLGIALGRVENVTQVAVGAALGTLLVVGYGVYQVFGRR
jgi:hypothetical protein